MTWVYSRSSADVRWRRAAGGGPLAEETKDKSKAFYFDKLGFAEAADVTMGDGYRWVTVAHPDHPELELTPMKPGPPLDDEDAAAIRRRGIPSRLRADPGSTA